MDCNTIYYNAQVLLVNDKRDMMPFAVKDFRLSVNAACSSILAGIDANANGLWILFTFFHLETESVTPGRDNRSIGSSVAIRLFA